MPAKNSEAGRNIRALREQVGLLEPGGHEAMSGCITIPRFDESGNITGILGNRIDRKVKADDIIIGSGNVAELAVVGNPRIRSGG